MLSFLEGRELALHHFQPCGNMKEYNIIVKFSKFMRCDYYHWQFHHFYFDMGRQKTERTSPSYSRPRITKLK